MTSKSTKERSEFIFDSTLNKARGLFDVGLFFDFQRDSSNVPEEYHHLPAQAVLREGRRLVVTSPFE